MQIVLYSKILKDVDIPYVQQVLDLLQEKGVNVYVYKSFLEEMHGKIRFNRDVGIFEGFVDFSVKKIDLVISLGGDGTILGAVTMVRDSGVPILGINLGRLGFLASIEKTRIELAVNAIISGRVYQERRSLIYLESNLPLFGETPFALNDVTILKRDTSSMITIHAYVNGDYLNTYWADGIIVSTPTGSTGYSLSCGGPIVFPNSGNFVITPVAPHNLNVRPIVISDSSVVSFEIEGRAESFLCTLDSRFETITAAHRLAVRRCDFTVSILQIDESSFQQTIRTKLTWGIDTRNHG
ncbi:MAG: NAD kinase [Bacteroidota bacterium]